MSVANPKMMPAILNLLWIGRWTVTLLQVKSPAHGEAKGQLLSTRQLALQMVAGYPRAPETFDDVTTLLIFTLD